MGDFDVLGNLKIKHPRQDEVGAAGECVTKGLLRRDGPSGHGLKGDPWLFNRRHELGCLFWIGAPIAGELVVSSIDLVRSRTGGITMVMESLDIEVGLDAMLFTRLHHLER